MVAVTAYVGLDIMESIDSDWSHIAESFLMSTVALGGAINLMPLVFNKVRQSLHPTAYSRLSSLTLLLCATVKKQGAPTHERSAQVQVGRERRPVRVLGPHRAVDPLRHACRSPDRSGTLPGGGRRQGLHLHRTRLPLPVASMSP